MVITDNSDDDTTPISQYNAQFYDSNMLDG